MALKGTGQFYKKSFGILRLSSCKSKKLPTLAFHKRGANYLL